MEHSSARDGLRGWVLAVSVLGAMLLSGCVGSDDVLFVTSTTLGVDFATKPPTLTVGYHRQEGEIAPAYDQGMVLPTAASFVAKNPFSPRQSFATGTAAVILAEYMGTDQGLASLPPLTEQVIEANHPVSVTRSTRSSGKHFFFGTNTNFGLRIATDPNTYIDSISLAYKRQEVAYVPAYIGNETGNTSAKTVYLPSLLATMSLTVDDSATIAGKKQYDNYIQQASATNLTISSEVKNKKYSELVPMPTVEIAQFIATGKAASYFAAQPDIRQVLGARILQDSEVATLAAQRAKLKVVATRGASAKAANAGLLDKVVKVDGKVDPARLANVMAAAKLLGYDITTDSDPDKQFEKLKTMVEDVSNYEPEVANLELYNSILAKAAAP